MVFEKDYIKICKEKFSEESYTQLISISSLYSKFIQTLDKKVASFQKYPSSFSLNDPIKRKTWIHNWMNQFIESEIKL